MSDTAPGTKPAPRRRKWLIVTALALVVLGVLVLLPVAVQFGLRQWLLDNGGERVQVADVDLNLFTARLQLKGIRVEADGRDTLSIERAGVALAWLPLLQRRIVIEALTLDGIGVDITRDEGGRLRAGGINIIPPGGNAAPAAAEKAPPPEAPAWQIGVDSLTLSDIDIRYRDPKLQMDTRIERLGLRDLAAWRPDSAAPVSLRASVNGAPLGFEGSVTPFADSPQVDGRIELQDLPLADFQHIIGVAEQLAGRLSLQTEVSLALPATGIALQLGDSTLRLDQLQWVMPQLQLQQESLRWAGHIGLKQAGGTMQVSGAGDISGKQLDTTLPPQKLKIAQQALQLGIDFQLEINGTDDAPKISARLATLQVSELHGWADDFPLAGMGRLSVEDLRLHDLQTLEIDKIRIEQGYVAKAGDETPPLFSNHSLDIDTLALKEGNQLSIDGILLKQAKVYLTRAADGGSNLDALKTAITQITGSETATESSAKTPSANDKQTSSRPASFHIGHFQITDDSLLVFDDAAVKPKTRTAIGIDNLELDNIDNRLPDQVTRLKGKGMLGRFGRYQLSGQLQAFADKLTARIAANIQGLDLPPLSPYTASDLGFRLRSGTLSSDIDVNIERDQLGGEIKLTLRQLELIPVKDKGQEDGMMVASLDTSLNMLRDSNNTIALTIPLSGDIDAPDFNINDAISQALMSAARNGAMTYFMYALQPYGTMLAVAKFAGEQIAKVRLDPVTFGAGSSELDDTARDYLQKVARILRERPKVAIKVCGIAVDSDAAALTPAPEKTQNAEEKSPAKEPLDEKARGKRLERLAQQRAIAVREFIISRAGDVSRQLVSCLPEVESGKADAVPRVELLI